MQNSTDTKNNENVSNPHPKIRSLSPMHQVPNGTMKRLIPMPISSSASNLVVQDLLWISKQQQQHPLTHVHPLKNTIRVNSHGIRYKFDGKQWRPLCQSPDGFECRNLAFRSTLCQKHFYKIHLLKRPYSKHHSNASLSGKRSLLEKYEQQSTEQNEIDDVYEDDDDDPIEIIENHDAIVSKQETGQSQSVFSSFSIDCEPDTSTTNQIKSDSSNANRTERLTKRFDSTNTESNESIHLDVPPLTRTEEKSLANELIHQLPSDIIFPMGEQIARRRVCEIVYDNYSYRIVPGNISSEWFYDFLLRNPRVPIHFQSWFASIKSTLPSSDQLMDIKLWELGLVTRSVLSSPLISISSSSSSSPS